MKIVVDASIAVKWILPDSYVEPETDRALEILIGIKEGRLNALQPTHWLAEVAAVVTRLHPGTASRAIDLLFAMELPVVDDLEIYRRACHLSGKLGHHLFDTLYHAVAIESQATLYSADEHYCRKAFRLGHLSRLSDFKL